MTKNFNVNDIVVVEGTKLAKVISTEKGIRVSFLHMYVYVYEDDLMKIVPNSVEAQKEHKDGYIVVPTKKTAKVESYEIEAWDGEPISGSWFFMK